MKLNASKSKCLCISRSCTVNPHHGPLIVDGAPLTSGVSSVLPRKSSALWGRLTGFWVTSQSLPAASGVLFFHCLSIVLLCGLPQLCPTSVSLTELSPPLGSCVVAKQHGILVTDAMSAVSACYIRSMPTSFTRWMPPFQMHLYPPGTLDLRQIHMRASYSRLGVTPVSFSDALFLVLSDFGTCMLDEGTCTASDVHKFKSASNKILKSLVS